MAKTTSQLVREVTKMIKPYGWRTERTRNNHVRYVGPDGQVVVGSATAPDDLRKRANLLAELRRNGFQG